MPQLHPLTLTTLVRRARQDGCDDIYYYYAALHCMVLQCTLTAYQAKTQFDGTDTPERLLQEEHFQPLPNTSSFERKYHIWRDWRGCQDLPHIGCHSRGVGLAADHLVEARLGDEMDGGHMPYGSYVLLLLLLFLYLLTNNNHNNNNNTRLQLVTFPSFAILLSPLSRIPVLIQVFPSDSRSSSESRVGRRPRSSQVAIVIYYMIIDYAVVFDSLLSFFLSILTATDAGLRAVPFPAIFVRTSDRD